jgi:hypothetical protein
MATCISSILFLKNVNDIPTDLERAGTKENLNHEDHEEFEEQRYHFFLNLCELRALCGY